MMKKGHKMSEDHKGAIGKANSISLKGKKESIEHRKNISEGMKLYRKNNPPKNKGVPMSDKLKRMHSKLKIGDKCHLWKGGLTKKML